MSVRGEVSVCFVCLGNICRSPTAEGIFKVLVREHGLDDRVRVASAGTGSWHVGEPADSRARATARRRGVPLEGCAQQFSLEDFTQFDYILSMDSAVIAALRQLAPTDEARRRVHNFRAFDPGSPPDAPVPDPYFGGVDGFEEVFDICDAACRGLLAHIRSDLDARDAVRAG
jgi:protein-tyrosine phosphatase